MTTENRTLRRQQRRATADRMEVSDSALVRYMALAYGIDTDGLKSQLAAQVPAPLAEGDHTEVPTPAGYRLVVRRNIVTTILSA